jgi:hypothetical protein
MIYFEMESKTFILPSDEAAIQPYTEYRESEDGKFRFYGFEKPLVFENEESITWDDFGPQATCVNTIAFVPTSRARGQIGRPTKRLLCILPQSKSSLNAAEAKIRIKKMVEVCKDHSGFIGWCFDNTPTNRG